MNNSIENSVPNHPKQCYIQGVESLDSTLFFDKKIWRVEDVANFLGCTVGHVYNLASRNRIPKRKKNGFLFFTKEEIELWVLNDD